MLFVDDDSFILDALRDRLRFQHRDWEMTFVTSAAEALAVMQEQPIDAIVADMRMPVVDGAALLQTVQERHPHVIRIVLSGYTEYESVLRAVPVAHQYLNKPSSPEVIVAAVERACSLQELIGDPTVRRAIGRVNRLPSLPRLYSRLLPLMDSEDTCADDVAAILRQDMAMCAKVLQMANSAFFRLPRRISGIEEAVSYLGFNTIRRVVLTAELFHACDGPGPAGFSLPALQSHAIRVASLASSFFAQKQDREDAFAAGLLHDIGKLILALQLPEDFCRAMRAMEADPDVPEHEVEERIYGTSHAEVGGYLMALWGLAYPTVDAVTNHHRPERLGSGSFGLLAAVHIADALVNETDPDEARGSAHSPAPLDPTYIEALGVQGRVARWREAACRLSHTPEAA